MKTAFVALLLALSLTILGCEVTSHNKRGMFLQWWR